MLWLQSFPSSLCWLLPSLIHFLFAEFPSATELVAELLTGVRFIYTQ